jgi:membrane-bound serine protease (ClpP class)
MACQRFRCALPHGLSTVVFMLAIVAAHSVCARAVPLLDLAGPIGPASVASVEEGLAAAGAPVPVLRIDTPGGFDADWAERAVREEASLSAEAAHKLGVVDLIAPDPGDLLAHAHGRTVATAEGPRVLDMDAAGVTLEGRPPVWTDRVLRVLTDPNVAYILLLLGVYGLVYELANPGTVLPGTLGAICLVLAFFAFQMLPMNWTGLALIGLGLGLMIAEAFTPSFGVLGLGGIAAFVIGSLILIDSDAPGYAVSLPLIAGFAVASVVLLILVGGMAVRAHRRPVTTGAEELADARGLALSGFPGAGRVRVRGEVWSARAKERIPPGTLVRVRGREGLTLLVEPVVPVEPIESDVPRDERE